MNARRAARELTLLAFSQLAKNPEKWLDKEVEEIITVSVRTLSNEAENDLKTAVSALVKIKEYIENYEVDHPANAKGALDAPIIPVPIPLTSDMTGRIDEMLEIADKTFSAIEISEMSALANQNEIKEYVLNLARLFAKNSASIDAQISKHSRGWNIDRLVRVDRDILRIAITELLYVKGIPYKASIDEAVELAKKYSTEESSSFINGILRQVVEENNLIQTKG